METLEPNRERGRVKKEQRRSWAKALIRPQTLKMIIAFGRWTLRILQLVDTIIKVFRH